MNELERYSFIQLSAKPFPAGWSLGQVYMHLIEVTNYNFEQIHICLSNNNNLYEEMAPEAKLMFLNNDFPDEVIEGPPTNADTPQPENKEEIMRKLIILKDEINKMAALISKSSFQGKTKHPGLQYLNAKEWFQFTEMHLRHHLRQKKRIDDFLKFNGY